MIYFLFDLFHNLQKFHSLAPLLGNIFGLKIIKNRNLGLNYIKKQLKYLQNFMFNHNFLIKLEGRCNSLLNNLNYLLL